MENSTYAPSRGFTILLVETNIIEQEKFSQIAISEEWNLVYCKSGIEAIQWLQNNSTADLLVIQEDSLPLNGFQTADYIKSELGLALPVLISVDNQLTEVRPRVHSYVEGFVKKPFHKQSLIEDINAVFSKSIEIAPAQNNRYSLNYLNEIFDGNESIIMESLGLFQTSVDSELKSLNNVLTHRDFTKIREIAHGIKPSFAMLESETGETICHLINNEAKDEEMAYLIGELQQEFNIITEQLSRDFPELNSEV
ncbi:response regulator [Gillisia sp. M10.2A]|uniref:Response regulator n=1 Tax=Gillisia lutea TaxID=2909668 RepID=A0ABS9EIR9_9FLAO|nr:response regulator [Gillisia lutea]MCF4102745.1 response regulator [Gillisia lutea]